MDEKKMDLDGISPATARELMASLVRWLDRENDLYGGATPGGALAYLLGYMVSEAPELVERINGQLAKGAELKTGKGGAE